MTDQTAFRTQDVTYHTVDGAPLVGTLYLPQGEIVAGAVEVHGGGWTTGSRLNNKGINEALARAGVAVMALEFRMPPVARYPGPVADIHAGIRWFKANAALYGVPKQKIGGVATSSGAHQLLLATLRPDDKRYGAHQIEGGAVAGASLAFLVLCWPVSDPLARFRMVAERNNERLLKAHGDYFASEAEMSEANPQLILERGEVRGALPPALLLQGTNDDNLTPDMSERFAAAYRTAGGAITYETFAGEPHAFTSAKPDSPATQRALSMITQFVRGVARQGGPRTEAAE